MAVPSPCCSSSLHSGDLAVLLLMDSTLFFLPRDGLAGSLPSRDPVHHAFSSSLGTYHCQSGPARTCPPPGTWGSSKASRCGLLYHHLVSTKAATRLLPVGRLPATATRPAPGGATRRLGVAFSTITWFLQRPPLVFFLLGRLRCPLYHHLVFLGTALAFAFILCSGTCPPSPGLVPTSHISLGL